MTFSVVRWVHFTSVLLLFGYACFWRYAILEGDIRDAIRIRAYAITIALASLGLASTLTWLICETSVMAGNLRLAFDGPTICAVITQTTFGRIWTCRAILAALVLVLSIASAKHSGSTWLSTAAIVVSGTLVMSLAGTGHVASESSQAVFLKRVDYALHAIGAALWAGGLLALLVFLRSTAGSISEQVVVHAAARFSVMAIFSVACFTVTGIVLTNSLVGNWQSLWSTTYGQLLCAKIAAVFVALCIGAVNRGAILLELRELEVTPGETQERLLPRALIEQGLVQLAILAVGIFSALPPPAEN